MNIYKKDGYNVSIVQNPTTSHQPRARSTVVASHLTSTNCLSSLSDSKVVQQRQRSTCALLQPGAWVRLRSPLTDDSLFTVRLVLC